MELRTIDLGHGRFNRGYQVDSLVINLKKFMYFGANSVLKNIAV